MEASILLELTGARCDGCIDFTGVWASKIVAKDDLDEGLSWLSTLFQSTISAGQKTKHVNLTYHGLFSILVLVHFYGITLFSSRALQRAVKVILITIFSRIWPTLSQTLNLCSSFQQKKSYFMTSDFNGPPILSRFAMSTWWCATCLPQLLPRLAATMGMQMEQRQGPPSRGLLPPAPPWRTSWSAPHWCRQKPSRPQWQQRPLSVRLRPLPQALRQSGAEAMPQGQSLGRLRLLVWLSCPLAGEVGSHRQGQGASLQLSAAQCAPLLFLTGTNCSLSLSPFCAHPLCSASTAKPGALMALTPAGAAAAPPSSAVTIPDR